MAQPAITRSAAKLSSSGDFYGSESLPDTTIADIAELLECAARAVAFRLPYDAFVKVNLIVVQRIADPATAQSSSGGTP